MREPLPATPTPTTKREESPMERTAYTLTIRPDPGTRADRDIRRLRSFLKRLLRDHGLRCLALRPEPNPEPEANHAL